MEQTRNFKTGIVFLTAGIFILFSFGLVWFFFLGPEAPVGFGWYLFSFAAGLTMIILPCTLPLAFVIVPLSLGKGAAKGIGIAVSFGLGVALTLSLYGVAAALLGEVAIGTLGAPLEVVKNWLYFIAGTFAFLFALGEIGILNFRMPSYTGAVPAFIQRRQDILKPFLLGLFLGNVGVGCPHPATPVILTRIAVSGDVFYGWLLFFIHALGRIIPLLFLAFLAILGVNALSWLIKRKDKIERATGWGMIFVAGFILTLGLFSHDWWVYSGQHTLLEDITQEEMFLGVIINRFNLAEPPHTHGIPEGSGLFGLPLWLGNWFLVFLWVLPLWLHYFKKRKEKNEKMKIGGEEAKIAEGVMPYRFGFYASLTLFLAAVFIWILPDRFLYHRAAEERPEEHAEAAVAEEAGFGAEYAKPAQGADFGVDFTAGPAPIAAGRPLKFEFFVNKDGKAAEDLEVFHEKQMHVVGARRDLNEYFHLHPSALAPGLFVSEYTFAKPGVYRLWSEVQRGGIIYSFGHPEIIAEGEGQKENKTVSLGRYAETDGYAVSLETDDGVVKGRETELVFKINAAGAGGKAELADFLGEKMHLVIIKEDMSVFIHAHPENGHAHSSGGAVLAEALAHGEEEPAEGTPGVNFRVAFPEAGLYKMFAQFRPAEAGLPEERALTAQFWLEVGEKKTMSASAKWRLLLAVSAVFTIILSKITHKFLREEN